jgi:hypothetical protein
MIRFTIISDTLSTNDSDSPAMLQLGSTIPGHVLLRCTLGKLPRVELGVLNVGANQISGGTIELHCQAININKGVTYFRIMILSINVENVMHVY